MFSARDVFGLVGIAVGGGALFAGIQGGDWPLVAVGVAALCVGLACSFRRVVCPGCNARAWISSRRASHCMVCGAEYGGPREPRA